MSAGLTPFGMFGVKYMNLIVPSPEDPLHLITKT